MNRVSASILTCNLTKLGEQILAAKKGGADSLHIDIIDGVYVDNLSFGPKTVADLKEITNMPLDVHLELFDPIRYIDMFAVAGASSIAIQMDSTACPIRAFKQIANHGVSTGLAIAPKDRVDQAEYLLEHVDYVILMTVEPGFGGQKFGEFIYEKIHFLKKLMQKLDLDLPIYIDGGVDKVTAPKLLQAGSDVLISGSAIFPDNNISAQAIQENVRELSEIEF